MSFIFLKYLADKRVVSSGECQLLINSNKCELAAKSNECEIFYRAFFLESFLNYCLILLSMAATIVNFRGSRRRKHGNQMILLVDGVENKDKAKSLVGKTVVWTSPGKNKKEIKGKISAAHGNKGAVRAIFEKGMPGQSLSEKVKVE